MSNPNPSPETRFGAGQPQKHVKKKGDRDRLSAKCLYELAEDFEVNGKQAIVDLRTADPGRYIAAVIALIPKQVEVKRDPMSSLDGDKLNEAIETLTNMLRPVSDETERPALNS